MLTNEILDEIYQDREAHAELFNFKIDSTEKFWVMSNVI